MNVLGMLGRLRAGIAYRIDQAAGTTLGTYQAAIVRIGIAATWLLVLMREWPHRYELYGPNGPWNVDMAAERAAATEEFTVLLWPGGHLWFEIVYHTAIAATVALLVGWRTRTASVLFLVGVLSLQNINPFVGNGGDNLIHLMAIYLVFSRCGHAWSLDARKVRSEKSDIIGIALWSLSGCALAVATTLAQLSTGWAVVFWGLWLAHGIWWLVRNYAPGEPRSICDMIANLTHNGTLLVIMAQVCLIYAAAGWYKIQGTRWQDGTAVYYTLQLDAFTPWPAISQALSGSGMLIMLMTYGTVIVQVAFPFTLLNRKVKNVLLVLMIAEHVSIGVLLGLPFFSMAMIAVDAVFLPTAFFRRLEAAASRLVPGRRRNLPEVASPPHPELQEHPERRGHPERQGHPRDRVPEQA